MEFNKQKIICGGKICQKRRIENGNYLFKKQAKIKTQAATNYLTIGPPRASRYTI